MITNTPSLFVTLLVIGLILVTVNLLADWIIAKINRLEEWKKKQRRQA